MHVFCCTGRMHDWRHDRYKKWGKIFCGVPPIWGDGVMLTTLEPKGEDKPHILKFVWKIKQKKWFETRQGKARRRPFPSFSPLVSLSHLAFTGCAWSCLVLSCLVLSCLVLSCLVSSCSSLLFSSLLFSSLLFSSLLFSSLLFSSLLFSSHIFSSRLVSSLLYSFSSHYRLFSSLLILFSSLLFSSLLRMCHFLLGLGLGLGLCPISNFFFVTFVLRQMYKISFTIIAWLSK
jgi:hypothetical protein